MVARLYSFATPCDDDDPTRKAAIFIAAYARDFEEAGDTAIRQINTVPMAGPPMRGPIPAPEQPLALQSGIVRCLTPIAMQLSLAPPFRAEAANEVTMAPEVVAPASATTRARVCRGFAAALCAGASLVALYALGMQAPRVAHPSPHVVVTAGASRAHEMTSTKDAAHVPLPVRRPFGSAAPLPPLTRSRRILRTAPF